MHARPKTWLIFVFLAVIGLLVWYRFTYAQFAFIDLSIDRREAVRLAKEFLQKEKGVDPDSYLHAVVFQKESHTDRFLQKALGFHKEVEFLTKHDIDLFNWKNRFFRENEKEEFLIFVSAADGKVVDLIHTIPETAARASVSEDDARQTAVRFLSSHFDFDPEKYIPHSHLSKKFDNRTEHSFRWEKDIPSIKWNNDDNSGRGKVLVGATVAGEEVLKFSKDYVQVPDDFNRFLAREQETGSNLTVLFRIVFLMLLTVSIFVVAVRRNNLVLHTVKNFCLTLTAILFVLHLLAHLNHFQGFLMQYQTTAPLPSFLWRTIMTLIMDIFILTISILMPALAGESLHYEQFPKKPHGAFLHYIQSSFFARPVAQMIVLGYLTAAIMLGLQSLAFTLGQKYLGVWVEYTWMSHLTESYFPFFTALVIGLSAGLTEEITFRIFSISLGKKVLKKAYLAVVAAALIWGFGHSAYPVYPMWFRGLEVTLLGLLLGSVYLRFGIIPVIVAHYLFDVFWISAAYLLGQSTPELFFGSLALLILPIGIALVAWKRQGPQEERPLRWRLNKHQIFNLGILKDFLLRQKRQGKSDPEIKAEITGHGWDQAVVEIGLEEINNETEQ